MALTLLVAWRPSAAAVGLTTADVERIIGQAVAEAKALGLAVTVAVVDHEGNPLGVFRTTDKDHPQTTRLQGLSSRRRSEAIRTMGEGLEGIPLPTSVTLTSMNPFTAALDGATLSGAALAAISKAGTSAFFSTQGNAFTPRTASFIIQQHFPPGIKETMGGPLFGVQFSSLLCSDVMPKLPLGLSGDPGGLPLYKRGRAVGGIGVEGNGVYTADLNPRDDDFSAEERIAAAGTRGFETPRAIRADQILVGGLRFPFANTDDTSGPPAPPFSSLPGFVEVPPHDAPPSQFMPMRLGGVPGTVDPRFFPPKASSNPAPEAGGLKDFEVRRILSHAAQRANRLRAAIRRPLGDRVRVNITVIDRDGNILGNFRTKDAPVFGFDVSAQKARGVNFFSRPDAAEKLRALNLGSFVDAAARDGLRLDGSVAFAMRSIGFIARPFFPDGIDGTAPGPFSRPIDTWSVFNDGLQVELVKPALLQILTTGTIPPTCVDIPGLPRMLNNGTQIFAGAVPLFRGHTPLGAIGVSGDGIDQDDAVAGSGSVGFEAPRGMRADRVLVRGVRLPYFKRPRRPENR